MVETGKTTREVYLNLTSHNPVQVVIFAAIVLVTCLLFFEFVAIPLLKMFFLEFLEAKIESLPGWASYFSWDITVESNNTEAYYRLDPFLSFLPFAIMSGVVCAIFVTSILPVHLGFIHQKIHREIVNALDRIARIVYHESVDDEHLEVERRLISLDVRHMHELAAIFPVSFDDLDTLKKALIWRGLTGIHKATRVFDGLKLYMRNYFTLEYGNHMLGIVYIGAAVLIVIIGLRGLKFIPAQEPSIIIFALGLEFVLLIAYALTVIYTRDEDSRISSSKSDSRDDTIKHLEAISGYLQRMSGDGEVVAPERSRELEKLLMVFLHNKEHRRDDEDKTR